MTTEAIPTRLLPEAVEAVVELTFIVAAVGVCAVLGWAPWIFT